MVPLQQEHTHPAIAMLLDYLGDGRNATPNNMLEGMVSAKSLLRGIVSGALIICEAEESDEASTAHESPS